MFRIINFSTLSLALGLFFSGVLINPLNPTQPTKLIIADFFFLIGISALILSSLSKNGTLYFKISSKCYIFFQLLGLFLLWVFISGFFAVITGGIKFSVFTLTFANYLYGALIFCFLVAASKDIKCMDFYIFSYACGVLLVAGFSTMAIFYEAPVWVYHGGGRIKSTSQSVNQLAAFVAPAIPILLILSLCASLTTKVFYFSLVVSFLAVISLIGTGSRTALILIMVSLLLVFLAASLFWSSRKYIASFIIILSLFTTLGLTYLSVSFVETGSNALPSFAHTLSRPLDRFLSSESVEAGLGPRYDQIVLVSRNWAKFPIFGVGPGNFKNFMSSEYEVHNTYLGTLIETGVPGLTFLLLFQISILLTTLTKALGTGKIDQRIRAFAFFSAFIITCLYGFGSFGLRQRSFWIHAGFALGIMNCYWVNFGIPSRRRI